MNYKLAKQAIAYLSRREFKKFSTPYKFDIYVEFATKKVKTAFYTRSWL